MSKLLMIIATVLSAASASYADCPFKNMSTNAVGMFDQGSNAYFAMQQQPVAQPTFVQPVRRQK